MLLLSILALATGGGGLLLSAGSPKTTVLVGEPVKLVLTWRTTEPVRVIFEDGQFDSRSALGFAVDGGKGPRLYLEHGHERGSDFVTVASLKPGDRWICNLVLVRGSYANAPTLRERRSLGPSDYLEGFVFSRPGQYTIKVQHFINDSYGPLAESNAVAFTVVEPSGDDLAVFQRVAKDPEILAGRGEADALLRKYPKSPYLRWARIRRIGQMDANVGNGYDPEKGIRSNQPPLHKEERELMTRDFDERVAQELLSDEEWGAFEEERLALGLRHARDESIAAIFRKQLFEKFPDSRAVNEIKEEERESGEDHVDSYSHAAPKPTPRPE